MPWGSRQGRARPLCRGPCRHARDRRPRPVLFHLEGSREIPSEWRPPPNLMYAPPSWSDVETGVTGEQSHRRRGAADQQRRREIAEVYTATPRSVPVPSSGVRFRREGGGGPRTERGGAAAARFRHGPVGFEPLAPYFDLPGRPTQVQQGMFALVVCRRAVAARWCSGRVFTGSVTGLPVEARPSTAIQAVAEELRLPHGRVFRPRVRCCQLPDGQLVWFGETDLHLQFEHGFHLKSGYMQGGLSGNSLDSGYMQGDILGCILFYVISGYSTWIWQYKRWLADKLGPDVANSGHELTRKIADMVAKNYHAWSHSRCSPFPHLCCRQVTENSCTGCSTLGSSSGPDCSAKKNQ